MPNLINLMISTLYFIILIAFELWYLTSKQVKHVGLSEYQLQVLKYPQKSRIVGATLFLIATALFVSNFGWMSGISASIVGLMGVGCLIVMFAPFKYLSLKLVILLYIFFVILEIFI